MKSLILLATFVTVASAGGLHYAAGPVSTGTSSQFRQEDNYGNYQFGYDESHATGGSSRREEQSNGVRRGSYSLSDADGRQRTVHYVADETGFHATIQTNEPGVEPKDPADVLINKAAPVVVAAPLPAPVVAPAPLPIPAPVAVKGYSAARVALPPVAPAPVYAAPVAPIAPVAPVVLAEPETPRAFSYSFGASHIAPALAPSAPLPAPLPAPAAPIYQQQQIDY